jgi:hypothetical protein
MPLLKRRSDNIDTRDHLDPAGTGRDDRYPGRGETRATTPVAADERVSMSDHAGWNSAVRVLAMIGAGIGIVMGVIALFRLNWDNGLDAFPVDVAGLAFTPWVAIITVVVGIVALAAAASPDRGSKFVVGAILAILGIGILAASDANRADLQVERAHGWLALLVGAVLILAGLLLRNSWTTHRRVRTDAV